MYVWERERVMSDRVCLCVCESPHLFANLIQVQGVVNVRLIGLEGEEHKKLERGMEMGQ